jgi:hypothetical protein
MNKEEAFEELFETVVQPDYAMRVLNDLQMKYGFDTIEFLQLYCKDGFDLSISSSDARKWLFQLRLFLAAEGDLNDLEYHPVNRKEAQRASFFYAGNLQGRYYTEEKPLRFCLTFFV